MTQRDDGGPAYPTVAGQTVYSNGMTLRDYFAGQALAGIVSGHDNTGMWSWTPEMAAETAFLIAEAMLAARNKA